MTGNPTPEGVIKFQLEHVPAPSLPLFRCAELIAWRKILFQLQLIGQDPQRYDGYGFGNLSCRLDDGAGAAPFLVSGTQTGGLMELGPQHFVQVRQCFPGENRVISAGPLKPSSEAMTHAAIYQADPGARVVLHVHSPHIWQAATSLGLPMTAPEVPYGTLAMAEAVGQLLAYPEVRHRGILVMGGHEDGVVAFGKDAATAGSALLQTLAAAYRAALV